MWLLNGSNNQEPRKWTPKSITLSIIIWGSVLLFLSHNLLGISKSNEALKSRHDHKFICFHPPLPQVLSKLSAYNHSWVPPASLEAHSTAPTFLSCFPMLFKHRRFEQRFRQGHRNCSSWAKLCRAKSQCQGWGKPCCRAQPVLLQHEMVGLAWRRADTLKSSLISSHQFALAETELLLSLTLLSLKDAIKALLKHYCFCNGKSTVAKSVPQTSEPEQKLNTFSNHHVYRAVYSRFCIGVILNTCVYHLPRKVEVAEKD